MSTFADYFKLHVLVLIAGATGILGELIELPAPVIAFWRTLVASVVLGVMMWWKRLRMVERRVVWVLLGNGVLIGLHWVTFFWAIALSNVSVCMVAMATSALWAAVLEPVMMRERKFRSVDMVLGAVMVVAMGFLFGTDFKFALGLGVGIVSAGIAIVFTVINSRYTSRYSAVTITFWEMVGATGVSAGLLPFLPWQFPSASDTIYLLLLSVLCTVVAFTALTVLLRRVAVFAVALAYQLEPLYAIVVATLLFQDHTELPMKFYYASIPILVSAVVHPVLTGKRVR